MTAQVARAAFPRGWLAIRIRDALGELFEDAQFAGLFAVRGRPAVSPARLALVSVLQFAEDCRIARPPTRSAPASTGSTPSCDTRSLELSGSHWGGSTDVEGVGPGPVRRACPRLSVRRG